MITEMKKGVYITRISGIIPHFHIKKSIESLFKKWSKKYKKKIKVSTQGMASDNPKRNIMVRNSKDYSIQPLFDK